MSRTFANASPEKRFFVELITRDITLEDAVLDLIDNSIDSLARWKGIDLFNGLTDRKTGNAEKALPQIKITMSPKKFEIIDTCGGIAYEDAKNNVFRFGRPDPENKDKTLSVFGIGMKRALFKIGKRIIIDSRAETDGFNMNLDVQDWLQDPGQKWQFEIEKNNGVEPRKKRGTRIEITDLHEDVTNLFQTPVFRNKLYMITSKSYPFHLDRHLGISINSDPISSRELAFGNSDDIKPATKKWTEGDVDINLFCGLLPKQSDVWTQDNSGWYIICNGRVVLYADQTEITGWTGGSGLPMFQPKNRGFIGLASFSSNVPDSLPWKTTKRGVNIESLVYRRALKEMLAISRPVLRFQNSLYTSNDSSEVSADYKDAMNKLQPVDAARATAEQNAAKIRSSDTPFLKPTPIPKPREKQINFKVPLEEFNLVIKSLGNTHLSGSEVGRRIFKYYMKREC